MKSKIKGAQTQTYREGVPEPEGIGAGACARVWQFERSVPQVCVVTVTADTWFEARNIAAARLGVDPNVLRLV